MLRAFNVVAKPIGPICNLNCKYCFYLGKEILYSGTTNFKMSTHILENYVRQYIEAQHVPEIIFNWQGGEPTLLGVEFFQSVVELQQKYCPSSKRITNALQTNGTLLNERWCNFMRENKFLVGLSIDGPRELHDRWRLDKRGQPTFDRVMQGMRLLKHHGVEFNTLTVINRLNANYPLEIYHFLKKNGSEFMQFIPLVEKVGSEDRLKEPPVLGGSESSFHFTSESVEALAYGKFLGTIFDEWVHQDVGKIYVQIFEVQLASWMGLPSLCVFSKNCGVAVAMEHNGDVYSCDHYVYPKYKLGNILHQSLSELVESPQQVKFGRAKSDTLPHYCRECEFIFTCNGGCPKHRFLRTYDGELGLNYLCAGYKYFFHYINPYMRMLDQLLRSGQPADTIMSLLSQSKHRSIRL